MKETIIDGKTIAEIIPIILFLLFTLYTKPMVFFASSSLGRLFAILLITGYTMFDVLYGLIMCMMVILFYQLDYVEGMTSSIYENHENMNMQKRKIVAEELSSTLSSTAGAEPFGDLHGDDMLSHADQLEDQEGMTSMTTDHYFQKKYCNKSQLMYKEYPIKTEMAEHVFPEIKYTNGICNPCDPNCQFSIVNNKITTEEDLVKPKSSNDWFYESWKDIFGQDFNFLPAIGMHSEPFSVFM